MAFHEKVLHTCICAGMAVARTLVKDSKLIHQQAQPAYLALELQRLPKYYFFFL